MKTKKTKPNHEVVIKAMSQDLTGGHERVVVCRDFGICARISGPNLGKVQTLARIMRDELQSWED